MNLHACSNCWHNGLQYDSIGLRVGYCTRHRVVLRQADHSTCGQQIRKDLLYLSATRANKRQCEVFPSYEVVKLNGESLNGNTGAYVSQDGSLFTDKVGTIVTDYNRNKRIVAFSQLRMISGGRAELALLSLGRAYVLNCMSSNGKWTSGIHLLWWVGERFRDEPEPYLRYDQDIRYELPVSPERQLELARYSLLMLRLIFLSDMGLHAGVSIQKTEGSPVIQETSRTVQGLQTVADEAAEATDIDLRQLQSWIRDVGMARLTSALPKDRYQAIADELHKDSD